MALYVDKHRPKSFDTLDFHPALTERLQRIASDFPHLLFYGPSGAGKKTRIMCLLRQVYGAGVDKVRRHVCARSAALILFHNALSAAQLKVEHRRFQLPSKKFIELTCDPPRARVSY